MDDLIDELLAKPFTNSMVTMYVVEREEAGIKPVHELAIGVDASRDVGSIQYLGMVGRWLSQGTRSPREKVFYYHRGHAREYPHDSEVPLDRIRQAAREFLNTGGARPTGVTWQPDAAYQT